MIVYKYQFWYALITTLDKKLFIFISHIFLVFLTDNFEDETEDDDLFETEFRQYKRTYYMTKMGVDVVSEYAFFHCFYFAVEKVNFAGLQKTTWF